MPTTEGGSQELPSHHPWVCVPKKNSSKWISTFYFWDLGAEFPLVCQWYSILSSFSWIRTQNRSKLCSLTWEVREVMGNVKIVSFHTFFHVKTQKQQEATHLYYLILKRNTYQFCFSTLASSSRWTVQVIRTAVWWARNHSTAKTVQVK